MGKQHIPRICILLYCLHYAVAVDAQDEFMEIFKVVFSDTTPPTLFSRNECGDIADGLAGTRGAEMFLVELSTSMSLPPSLGTPACVVNWVYLDNAMTWRRKTLFDVFTTSENTRGLVDSIWSNPHTTLSKNQQLAVVACDMTANDNDTIPHIPLDTNFDFVSKDSNQLSVEVMQCYPGFCSLRITSKTCLLPLISEYIGALPATVENSYKRTQVIVSMRSVGVASIFMNLTSYSQDEESSERVMAKGLSAKKSVGTLKTVCINIENLPCTQEEAEDYGGRKIESMKSISPVGELPIQLVNVTKLGTSDNIFLVNFYVYQYGFDMDDTLGSYVNEFRTCPKSSMTTGDHRFFYKDSAVFGIRCVACPMNTYYSESRVPPAIVKTIQNMYIIDRGNKENRNGEYHTEFAISNTTSVRSSQTLFLQRVINIGTTLRLHVPANKLATQSIGAVECEGLPVVHTRINSSLISIEITMEHSGKLMVVYINDTSLHTGPAYFTSPVHILPRHSEITGTCLKCPPGTFAGSYGSADISECKDTARPTTAQRRLLSTDHTHLTSIEAAKYVEIQGQASVVLGIQNDNLHPNSDFSISVVLLQRNLKFVQDNIEEFVKRILEIYNVENSAVQHTVTFVRLHASNTTTVIGIRGNYTGTKVSTPGSIPGTKVSTPGSSLFGWSLVSSILISTAAGIVVLIMVAAIISVVANKCHKHEVDKHKAGHMTEAGYCMVCQGELQDIAVRAQY